VRQEVVARLQSEARSPEFRADLVGSEAKLHRRSRRRVLPEKSTMASRAPGFMRGFSAVKYATRFGM